MNRLSKNLLASYQDTQKRSLRFGQLMVIGMMMCLSVAYVQFGERIYSDWRGGYIIFAGLLVAIESMATRRQTEDLEFRQKLFFHLSEWIAIAVLVKILIYVEIGPANIISDLSLWQSDFLQYFFTFEFIFSLMILAVIWIFSRSFTDELDNLYQAGASEGWEDLGKLQNILHELREKLVSRLLVIGTVIVGLAVLSRLTAKVFFLPASQMDLNLIGPVVNVVVYFMLSLILISQTQFALLQTRWLWQGIPVNPQIRRSWVKYGSIFFALVAGLVILLPTQYTVGLFDMLRYVVEFLSTIFSFLLVIITLPLTLCLSLFSMVNGSQNQPVTPSFQMPDQPHTPATPIAWLELLRSFAFWVIFLAIIFFAIRFYLMQNTQLWSAIASFPFFRWVANAWSGFWTWIKGTNRQVARLIRKEIQRLRQSRLSPDVAIPHFFNLSQMNPRARIIHFYMTLLNVSSQQGLGRKPSQTPYQYQDHLKEAVPEAQEDLSHLTAAFIEARYSQHPIGETQSSQASTLLDRIKAIMARRKPAR